MFWLHFFKIISGMQISIRLPRRCIKLVLGWVFPKQLGDLNIFQECHATTNIDIIKLFCLFPSSFGFNFSLDCGNPPAKPKFFIFLGFNNFLEYKLMCIISVKLHFINASPCCKLLDLFFTDLYFCIVVAETHIRKLDCLTTFRSYDSLKSLRNCSHFHHLFVWIWDWNWGSELI